MKKPVLFLSAAMLLFIMGCAPLQAQDSPGVSGPDPVIDSPALPPAADNCGYPPEWIGKPVDRKTIESMNRPTRILHPNSPMTMDYSPNRLNIIIDDNDTVIEVKCG